jgi:hypothetical protein
MYEESAIRPWPSFPESMIDDAKKYYAALSHVNNIARNFWHSAARLSLTPRLEI